MGFAADVAPAAAMCCESWWGDVELWGVLARAAGTGGATPLHAAVAAGASPGRVAFLLARGAPLDAPDAAGRTALQCAADAPGGEPASLALLAAGAAPQAAHLAAAARAGHAALVDALLSAGVPPLAATPGSPSPLIAAAERGHPAIVAALLRAGAPPNAPGRGFTSLDALTPLQAATRCVRGAVRGEGDHRENDAVLALLDGGASPIVPAELQQPLLHADPNPLVAAAWWASEEVVRRLIAAGSPPGEADRWGRTALHYAAETGNLGAVRALLRAHAPVDTLEAPHPYRRCRPLLLAAKSGHAAVVAALAGAGADVLSPGVLREEDSNALLAAAEGGHADVVAFLLSRGALAAAGDGGVRAALRAGARGGSPIVIAALLAAAADARLEVDGGGDALVTAAGRGSHAVVSTLLGVRPDGWGRLSDALCLACAGGHAGVAELLLASGAAPTDAECPRVLLHAAAGDGMLGVVAAMLGRGADPNFVGSIPPCDAASTPLLEASRHGREAVVHLLLSRGADPNKRALPTGETPLHASVAHRRPAVAGALLTAGATPDPLMTEGGGRITPLLAATASGERGMVSLLLQAGADPNVVNERAAGASCYASEGPLTALHEAVVMEDVDAVALLLQHGADPNARATSADGPTALHLAAARSHVGILRLLLLAGAEVNAWRGPPVPSDDAPSLTPLLAALDGDGDADVVSALLDSGADVHAEGCVLRWERQHSSGHPWNNVARCPRRASPLVLAAYNGLVACVPLLLACGADVNRPVADGRTALHAAAAAGHEGIVGLLLLAGANPAAMDDEGRMPDDAAAEAGNHLLAARMRDAAEATKV